MNLVDFYKKLSDIMEATRIKSITRTESKRKLTELVEEGKKHNIDANIDIEEMSLFENLEKYDDEMSYEEYIESYESSYDDYDDNGNS